MFAELRRAFAPFPEDVVAPCAQCSQDTLWSVAALERFCDGLVQFWLQDPRAISQLFSRFRVDRNSFNDMNFLDIFVHGPSERPRSRLLAHARPSAHYPRPRVWLPATSLLALARQSQGANATCDTHRHTQCTLPTPCSQVCPLAHPADCCVHRVWHRCESALRLISFTGGRGAGRSTSRESSHGRGHALHPSPSLARPRLPAPGGQAIPLIHFQGGCKESLVHRLYLERYAADFAASRWALRPEATRRHQSWWNAWAWPKYDW